MESLLEAVSPSPDGSPQIWPEPWPEPADSAALYLAEPDGEPLASLLGDTLSPRFCSWRGASGRRYIVSVYDFHRCPAYCDAVLIAVSVAPDGRRRPLALADTGVFPEPLIARMARSLAAAGARMEFHLHLLAASSAERKAALDDLAAAAPYAERS
jgi:hypothetical protein